MMVRKLGEIKWPLTALSDVFSILSEHNIIWDKGEVVTCSLCLAIPLSCFWTSQRSRSKQSYRHL